MAGSLEALRGPEGSLSTVARQAKQVAVWPYLGQAGHREWCGAGREGASEGGMKAQVPLALQATKTGQQRAEPQLCPLSSSQGHPKEPQ